MKADHLPTIDSAEQTSRAETLAPPVGHMLLAGIAALALAAWFVLVDPSVRHWFVLPVTLCGVLTFEVLFRGLRRSIIDPMVFVGGLGVHFFFLAPLLHVHWDYWMIIPFPPADWREWLGKMAALNALGLVLFRVIAEWGSRTWRPRRLLRVNYDRFAPLAVVALVCTLVMQLAVYARFGGVAGYVAAASDSSAGDSMQGLGWVFLISESFPIVALMLYAIYLRKRGVQVSLKKVVGIVAAYFLLKLFFGGLRGSRSATIWGMVWAVGIIHLWIRQISLRFVAVLAAVLVAFMYFYGFFKARGLEALPDIGSAEGRERMSASTGRTLEATLLGDLARADVQSFLLYSTQTTSFEPALGRTYLGAAAILVPASVWPDRPVTKVMEGTDLQYGPGTFHSGVASSRVYGMAGEAMLNFGWVSVPFVYGLVGLLVRFVRRRMSGFAEGDIRLLIAPFFATVCAIVIASDSDNIVFLLIKNLSVPALLIALTHTSTSIRIGSAEGRG